MWFLDLIYLAYMTFISAISLPKVSARLELMKNKISAKLCNNMMYGDNSPTFDEVRSFTRQNKGVIKVLVLYIRGLVGSSEVCIMSDIAISTL